LKPVTNLPKQPSPSPAYGTTHTAHPSRLQENHHVSPEHAISEVRWPRYHHPSPHTIAVWAENGANTCGGYQASTDVLWPWGHKDCPSAKAQMQKHLRIDRSLWLWYNRQELKHLFYPPKSLPHTHHHSPALKWLASLCNGHFHVYWIPCLGRPSPQTPSLNLSHHHLIQVENGWGIHQGELSRWIKHVCFLKLHGGGS